MLDSLAPRPEGAILPDGMIAARLETADGVSIRAAFLAPSEGSAKGTVIFIQGRGEFIEKYGEIYAELHRRGFGVVTFDLRGQGGSARQLGNPRKGHVEDFEDYLIDLAAVIEATRQRALPEPFGLLAHSTGGAVGLLALERGDFPFRRAVFSSPLVGLPGLAGSTGARLLARVLASLGLSGLFVPGGGRRSILEKPFEENPLTHDAHRFALAGAWLKTEPALGVGDPTIGWVDAAFEAMNRFADPDFGARNETPLLILTAGDDTVVDKNAAAALASRMRAASAIELRGAHHEIMIETNQILEQFWSAFDAFMLLPRPQAEETAREAPSP
ncbi:MAG: alpha/beta hydrolase [Proteobacteria bacterium]|nr:alpha/beta hydrolase [Pseudomonadota bacterium]